MYYLLAISLTAKERKKYKAQLKSYKRDLQKKSALVRSDEYLTQKEKLVLKIAMRSFTLARLLYRIKNIKGN